MYPDTIDNCHTCHPDPDVVVVNIDAESQLTRKIFIALSTVVTVGSKSKQGVYSLALDPLSVIYR